MILHSLAMEAFKIFTKLILGYCQNVYVPKVIDQLLIVQPGVNPK